MEESVGQQGQFCFSLWVKVRFSPCFFSFWMSRFPRHVLSTGDGRSARGYVRLREHITLRMGYEFYPGSLAKACGRLWGEVLFARKGSYSNVIQQRGCDDSVTGGSEDQALWTAIQSAPCPEVSNLFSFIFRSWNWLDWIFHTLLQTFHWTGVKIVTQTSYHVRWCWPSLCPSRVKGLSLQISQSLARPSCGLSPQGHLCACTEGICAPISLDPVTMREDLISMLVNELYLNRKAWPLALRSERLSQIRDKVICAFVNCLCPFFDNGKRHLEKCAVYWNASSFWLLAGSFHFLMKATFPKKVIWIAENN